MPKHEKPKLFKIRCTEEAKKFGIAAFTLKELIQKGCKLFQLLERKTHCCLYEDGTILTDEYFQRLPDNTELVLFSDGQSWNKLVYELGRVLGTDAHADDLISAARKLQTDEISAKWQKIVCDFLCNMKDNADMENRDDDSDWFEGIDTRFKTKSSYMKYNCEQRIRGYLKEVQGHAQTIKNAKQKREYDKVVASLAEKLKSAHYHGTYFDRTEKERHRLCTTEGWFSCQGAFDQDKCKLLHSINPYCNRENRILFSTWNLDHRIEKKRAIIPTLVEVLHGKKSSDINLDYFYKLLFTQNNLRLVHIVCHKKGVHDLTCNSNLVYKCVKKTRH